jgi:hypothetical protein
MIRAERQGSGEHSQVRAAEREVRDIFFSADQASKPVCFLKSG